jgi:hypothetical protein
MNLDDFFAKTANALLATTDAGPDNAFAPLVHLIVRLERIQRPSSYRHNRKIAVIEVEDCMREARALQRGLPRLNRYVMRDVLQGLINSAWHIRRKMERDERDQATKAARTRARGQA